MHLINSYANTVILHIEVKNLLQNNCQSNIENQEKNVTIMIEKCFIYRTKKVFISGLVYTARIVPPDPERTH